MASLNSLISGQPPKERGNGFAVTMVHYSKLVPSENNNYSTDNIEELARAILLSGGIKQNLLARKKSPDEYELIAGHRRRLAVKYLVEEMGLDSYAMVPVHVEKDGDVISEINLILANCSVRERTDWEKMMEVTRLTELVKALQTGTEEEQERFRKLFGKEPSLGGRELRKVVAESLGLSETRVANFRHIEGSLVPELKEKFQTGEIGVSVANEAAGLPAKEQVELSQKDKIQLSDVRKKAVSDSDTEKTSARISQPDPSSSCPPQIGNCRRMEWGTSPEQQLAGKKECSRCWEAWRENQKKMEGKDKPKEDVEFLEEEQEPLSAHGTPKKVYPEGSLIAIVGCESKPGGPKGGYNCFSCARECEIRQEDCYCIEAPLEMPYSCETMAVVENLRDAMGDRCQFVNLDLAYRSQGNQEPVPCCKNCKEFCPFRCGRGVNVIAGESETVQTEEALNGTDSAPEPGEVKIYDRDSLINMISNAEYMMKIMGEDWMRNVPGEYTKKAMEIQAYKNLLAEHDAAEASEPGLVDNPDQGQPDLPNFRNDDQRKSWIKDYKAWGLWYRDEHIDVNYYKFDFDNGTRLVATEFPEREWNWGSNKSDYVFYHLIEKGKKKSDSIMVYDDKYQYHGTCETELVGYLKRVQQKKKGEKR